MLLTENRYISFARIMSIERGPQVEAVGPDGQNRVWSTFVVNTDMETQERFLFVSEEEREKGLQRLVDDMEAAGY